MYIISDCSDIPLRIGAGDGEGEEASDLSGVKGNEGLGRELKRFAPLRTWVGGTIDVFPTILGDSRPLLWAVFECIHARKTGAFWAGQSAIERTHDDDVCKACNIRGGVVTNA